MWRIVQNSSIKIDNLIDNINAIPYTFSYLIRKRMQIDGWMELPKDKRPPESIWDDPEQLEEWFDRVFGDNVQTEFNVGWEEDEVEK